MAPVFFDPHVCTLPSTANLLGVELDFECRCGRRWRLEHYLEEGGIINIGLGRGAALDIFNDAIQGFRVLL